MINPDILDNFWYVTYSPTVSQLTAGFTQDLINRARILFNVTNELHSLGIVKINATANTVTMNISSTPQQVVFSVGDEKKFDLNTDNYYDISIKLISISGAYARVMVKTINEKMPLAATPSENNTTTGITNAINNVTKGINANVYLKWIIIIALVVIIVAIISVVVKKSKKR